MVKRTNVQGPEYADALASVANIVTIYIKIGRWKEAEEVGTRVKVTCMRDLGSEHPLTLFSMANLAKVYFNQGLFDKAEEIGSQVMATRTRVMGREHPDTLTSMASLATTYRYMRRMNEAEDLHRTVLEKRREVLGPEHPDTLASVASLATTYTHRRVDEAEDLHHVALAMRRKVLGPEHPDTLASMACLGKLYSNQRRLDEAEKLQYTVMETRRRVLGPEHPDTLTSMSNLALTYWGQSRKAEAENLMRAAVERREKVLGPEHLLTEGSASWLSESPPSGEQNETQKIEDHDESEPSNQDRRFREFSITEFFNSFEDGDHQASFNPRTARSNDTVGDRGDYAVKYASSQPEPSSSDDVEPGGGEAQRLLLLQPYKSQANLQVAGNPLPLNSKREDDVGAICAWLVANDPSRIHAIARSRSTTKDRTWLQNKYYKSWMRGSTGFLLFVGSPGCGKTTLASRVIESIKALCEYLTLSSIGWAYYYFEVSRSKDSVPHFLRWVINQLCEQSNHVPEDLRRLYHDGKEPTTSDLVPMLSRVLEGFQRVHLILDAVDEPKCQRELLEALTSILRFPNLKIFATSRDGSKIVSDLGKTSIDIISESEIFPVDDYIHRRLQDDPEFATWSAELKHEVTTTLQKGSVHTLVQLQLDQLSGMKNASSIRSKLLQMPKTLSETCEQIILAHDHQVASRALTVLASDDRVRTLEELVSTIQDTTTITLSGEKLLQICGGLITHDKLADQQVQLVHFSVKEFAQQTLPQLMNSWREDHSDVASIASTTMESVFSQETNSTELSSIAGAASDLLTSLFLNDVELKTLVGDAFIRMSLEKFTRNFSRLLKLYSRDLRSKATNALERNAAFMVRRQRFYLARAVAEKANANAVDFCASGETIGLLDTREKVEGWLSGSSVSGALKEDFEELENANDSSSDESEDEVNLKEVEKFMITGLPYSNFKEALRSFIFPHHEKPPEKEQEPNENESDNSPAKTQPVEGEESFDNELITEDQLPSRSTKTIEQDEDKAEKLRSSPTTPQTFDLYKELYPKILVYASWTPLFRSLGRIISPVKRLRCLWGDSIPRKHVRVTWICRCGRRLSADFKTKHHAAAVEFAKEAAGPANEHTVSSRSSDDDSSITSSSGSSLPQGLTSPTPTGKGLSDETPPSSAPSEDEDVPYPVTTSRTKRFLLLCVNGPLDRISLGHVNLTNIVESDEVLFHQIKQTYGMLRGGLGKNPFLVVKTMQYLKFQLVLRHKSKECVGSFEVDSIPSKAEMLKFQYDFEHPRIGKLPIPPHIFMHSFREPGDHLGDMIFRALPKKLRAELTCENLQQNRPIGWGIHIIEGANWRLIRVLILVALLLIFVGTVLWCALRGDIQGGAGLGQFAVGLLALGVPVVIFDKASQP
ncbi:MAG: hypothetical protein M4579_005628 [Chaenotheca gracillima]|nr:MAG: hypothetical protein M4579_005628 [Chaenotheca gracillima]